MLAVSTSVFVKILSAASVYHLLHDKLVCLGLILAIVALLYALLVGSHINGTVALKQVANLLIHLLLLSLAPVWLISV